MASILGFSIVIFVLSSAIWVPIGIFLGMSLLEVLGSEVKGRKVIAYGGALVVSGIVTTAVVVLNFGGHGLP